MKPTPAIKKWIIFGLITAVATCTTISLYAMKPIQEAQEEKPVALKQVTVQAITSGTYASNIKGYGEVTAKWSTLLRAGVGGRIIRINDKVQPGQQISAGTPLLELDRTDYLVSLAQAKLELENARVNLIKVEQEAGQARSDWKRSGITQAPNSPLVFHEPQLEAARALAALARKNMDKALNDLKQTRILAPYDGLVVERFVNKGETLFAGDNVLKILSADELEIGVSLDEAQVRAMGDWQRTRATILDTATGRTWPGKIVRDGGMMDRTTRLRKFYLVPLDNNLDNNLNKNQDNSPDLVPGMFVTVVIQGKPVKDLLALPESAMTRDGRVWLVDRENRLQPLRATPVFYEDGQVYIAPPEGQDQLRLVVTPGPGFISGTRVTPVIQGEN